VLLFVSVDDGCEDTGQVAVRFDFVQFAGLDQRREHGPVLCASVVDREGCVFTLQRDGPDRAFHGITVRFDATVGQERDQAIPVFGYVFEGEACRGFDSQILKVATFGADFCCRVAKRSSADVPRTCASTR
jgi:hypothetical protein